MKKLSIIAGLVFTTVFFASCESKEVRPEKINSNAISQPADFVEPEFAAQKRPSTKTVESTIVSVSGETFGAVETKLEK
jgi:PBP1b-binding outer membrane lipoprotein LpoB